MQEKRPPIPEELKRRVYTEAGHRCSIPTCRQIICEIHHIEEWSKVKEHAYENLICLCSNCHTMTHLGKIDKKSLRIYKHNLGLLHDKYTQFEIDMLFDLHKRPNGSSIYLPDFMYYMIRRTEESGMIKIVDKQRIMVVSAIEVAYIFIELTDTGRDFIDNLSR